MNVILQPCANQAARQNYAKTILKPVNFIGVPVFAPIAATLQTIYSQEITAVWGVTPGRNGQKIGPFKRIAPGDTVLFYRDNEVFGAGKVAMTTRSPEIADYLWGPESPGVSFELLYFLNRISQVQIPRSALNRAIPYKENFIVQSFAVLDTRQSKNVLNAFPVLADLSGVTAAEYQAALDGLQALDSLDRKVEALSRVEQAYLRQMLFPEPTGKCAICGKELPTDLLVAGHIKRRSACSVEEKRDAQHVVMPVCKLGCDELFERGYISVDLSSGRVVASSTPKTAMLGAVLESLHGRLCSSFRDETRPYFQWHFNIVYRQ